MSSRIRAKKYTGTSGAKNTISVEMSYNEHSTRARNVEEFSGKNNFPTFCSISNDCFEKNTQNVFGVNKFYLKRKNYNISSTKYERGAYIIPLEQWYSL